MSQRREADWAAFDSSSDADDEDLSTVANVKATWTESQQSVPSADVGSKRRASVEDFENEGLPPAKRLKSSRASSQSSLKASNSITTQRTSSHGSPSRETSPPPPPARLRTVSAQSLDISLPTSSSSLGASTSTSTSAHPPKAASSARPTPMETLPRTSTKESADVLCTRPSPTVSRSSSYAPALPSDDVNPWLDEDIDDPWLMRPTRQANIQKKKAQLKAEAEAEAREREFQAALSSAKRLSSVDARSSILASGTLSSSGSLEAGPSRPAPDVMQPPSPRSHALGRAVTAPVLATSTAATSEPGSSRSRSYNQVVGLSSEAIRKALKKAETDAQVALIMAGEKARKEKQERKKRLKKEGKKEPDPVKDTAHMKLPEFLEYHREHGNSFGNAPRSRTFAGSTVFYFPNEGLDVPLIYRSRGRIEVLVGHAARLALAYDETKVDFVIIDQDTTRSSKTLARLLGYDDIRSVPKTIPIYSYEQAMKCCNENVGSWEIKVSPRAHSDFFDFFVRERFLPPLPLRKRKAKPPPPRRRRGASTDSDDSDRGKESSPEPDHPTRDGPSHPESNRQNSPAPTDPSESRLHVDAAEQKVVVKSENEQVEPPPVPMEEEDADDLGDFQEPDDRFKPYKYACWPQSKGFTSSNKNQKIISELKELIAFYESTLGDKNTFKAIQTRKALNAVRRHPARLRYREDVEALPDVGEKTAEKILQIIRTGTTRQMDEERKEPKYIAMQKFIGIYGVGAATARKWVEKGLRTLEDVRNGMNGVSLNNDQLLGLTYYDDINERMPREEAKMIFEQIRDIALKIDPKLRIEAMGSYRRGKETCGDLDILITRPTDDGRTHEGVLERLLRRLRQKQILRGDLALPDENSGLEGKYMGLCASPTTNRVRRLDILTIPFESWGAALLYFTGDDIFNRSMRLLARRMGYSLSQRGLYADVSRSTTTGQKLDGGRLVASRTEREIFQALGIPWQEPHERTRS